MKKNRIWMVVFGMMIACTEIKTTYELPVLGRPEIVEKEIDGQIKFDTIPHKIADFSFVDQDSSLISNTTFDGQVYVADFFFTSCPTICPKMKQQMLRIYEKYQDEPQVAILSHTIDPEFDTVELLADYAQKLGVRSDKWHFVTGDKNEIYDIGELSYMVVANEDSEAPGGFIHSGAFLLVDKDRQIRGVYDGTIPEQVDILLSDIDRLLRSYDTK